MSALDIRLLPALSDNYVFLLRDTETGTVGVVDPAEDEAVQMELERLGWRLNVILNTHHHADHTAGNAALKRAYGATVIGPRADRDRIPELDTAVGDGDRFRFGALEVDVFDVPGHTSGHIAFHIPAAHALFCGDTLFSLGCGRLFEGTPAQMWDSLSRLRALPDDTLVHCGHEYTAGNARYALSIDPDNATLQARAREVEALRREGKPTIPSRLGTEKAANPFLRADDPGLAAAMGFPVDDPAAVLAEIRRRKDHFRG